MLSNEHFQGTRNAEPVLSPCRVPGKPGPPLLPGQATSSLLETWGSVQCEEGPDIPGLLGNQQPCAPEARRQEPLEEVALPPDLSAPLLPADGVSRSSSRRPLNKGTRPAPLTQDSASSCSYLGTVSSQGAWNPKLKNNFPAPPSVRDSLGPLVPQAHPPCKLSLAHTPQLPAEPRSRLPKALCLSESGALW